MKSKMKIKSRICRNSQPRPSLTPHPALNPLPTPNLPLNPSPLRGCRLTHGDIDLSALREISEKMSSELRTARRIGTLCSMTAIAGFVKFRCGV